MKNAMRLMVCAALAAGAACASLAATMEVLMWAEMEKELYADGSPVLPGEWYALVWLADGETFRGFNADCTLVGADDAKNHFFKAQPLDPEWVDEGWGQMQFNFDPGSYLSKGGTWNVFLLDTRKVTGVDGAGNPTYAVSDFIPGQARPEVLNAWGLEATAEGLNDDLMGEDGATADNVSEAPAGAEAVKVAAIDVGADTVRLTVTNTLHCLWYNVTRSAGLQNASVTTNAAVRPVNGAVNGETIQLEVPKASGETKQFYRVIRQTVK